MEDLAALEPVAPVLTSPAPEPDADDLVRLEIEAALDRDETALGDVWRRTKAGQSDDDIRIARGAERPNFLWNYRRTSRAFLGDLPTAPTVALAAARSLKAFLKRNAFTPGTRTTLEQRQARLETTASSQVAVAIEERQAREATVRAEESAVPGIYVYSLPHYMRHPYEELSGRTLMKVGRADRDVVRRFREQTRTTALPEDPVLLRVYQCEQHDSVGKERAFHRLLEAADHERSTARTGGTEWFLTTVRFLDEIAAVLDLRIQDVADLADASASSTS